MLEYFNTLSVYMALLILVGGVLAWVEHRRSAARRDRGRERKEERQSGDSPKVPTPIPRKDAAMA
jgi:hypothetical protein